MFWSLATKAAAMAGRWGAQSGSGKGGLCKCMLGGLDGGGGVGGTFDARDRLLPEAN